MEKWVRVEAGSDGAGRKKSSGREREAISRPRSNLVERSEREIKPHLDVAGASRTDDRIAGRDVGCGAPAAERAGGRAGVTASTIIIHGAERIGEEGVIEYVKDLEPELGGV